MVTTRVKFNIAQNKHSYREMKSLKFSIFNLQQTNHIILHEFQFLFRKIFKYILKSVFSNQIYYVLCFIEVEFAHWICKYVHSVWFLIMLWYLTICIIDEHVSFEKYF